MKATFINIEPRKYSSNRIRTMRYRFGFGGHENDNEVKGTGNQLSFGDYGYDPRLGRRLNIDPRYSDYPNQSPYSAFNNNPILYDDPSGESGEVSINKKTKTITITSKIILYGSGANKFLAATTARDIQKAWNKANGKVNIKGQTYKVKFVVTGEFRADDGVLKEEIKNNTDIKNNYIRVEKNTPRGTSFTDERGGNTGFYQRDQITENNSTTEGHEFGHGYGLPHPEEFEVSSPNGIDMGYDYRGNGQPNIMFPIATLVDPGFALPDGYLDPSKRIVTQENINSLGLDKIKFDKDGKSQIGKLTNEYHTKKE